MSQITVLSMAVVAYGSSFLKENGSRTFFCHIWPFLTKPIGSWMNSRWEDKKAEIDAVIVGSMADANVVSVAV